MYLVSSCLAGTKCRYDGNDNAIPGVVELNNKVIEKDSLRDILFFYGY